MKNTSPVTVRDNFAEITEFEKNSDNFIKILDSLAKEVEKEKMKTIGARNLLRSVAKQREAQKQQMQVLRQTERITIRVSSINRF